MALHVTPRCTERVCLYESTSRPAKGESSRDDRSEKSNLSASEKTKGASQEEENDEESNVNETEPHFMFFILLSCFFSFHPSFLWVFLLLAMKTVFHFSFFSFLLTFLYAFLVVAWRFFCLLLSNQALFAHGFPTPVPVDVNRHCIVMSHVQASPL
jgi:cation transport ATPase